MRAAEAEYNEVPYPSAVYPLTHPDRMGTVGYLFGLNPAAVAKCQVLELGCGDAANLISMASELPEAQFAGFDLSGDAISRGRQMIEALGLRNIRIEARDIVEARLAGQRFDYIVAHGLYSWVPERVRDRIMEICRDCLAADGIAFISYNAYPGNHLRDLVRGMMQYHGRNFPDPMQQVRQGRGLLKAVAEAAAEPSVYHTAVRQEFERCVKYIDAAFYHDDLSAVNQPVYFWEFAEHAKAFGLQFLAEANIAHTEPSGLKPEVVKMLEELGPDEVIKRQQYLDFFKGRAFRNTLICRDTAKLNRRLSPDRIITLLAAAEVRSVAMNEDGAEDFTDRSGAVIATANAHARAALHRLGEMWPQRVLVSELVAAVPEAEREDVLRFLLRCYEIGFINLHGWSPRFVTEISERPRTTPLARYQARLSDVLPTPRHTTIKIDGAIAQKLVQLLDGTREREALLRTLRESEPALTAGELETMLQCLARSGLLVA